MRYRVSACLVLLFISRVVLGQEVRPDLKQLLAEGRAIQPQVAEGLQLVAELEGAIERAFRATGRMGDRSPAAELGVDPAKVRGTYVVRTEVIGGTIVVTYGRGADDRIAGKTLVITPYQNFAGVIWWRCAEAQTPDGYVLLGTYAGTPVPLLNSTVSRAALPQSCLSTF